MKRFLLFFLLIFSVFASAEDICLADNTDECTVQSETFVADSVFEHDPSKICIIYFYGDGCKNCEKIKPFLDELEEKYSDKIQLHRLEIYHNLNNYNLYNKYCSIQSINLEKRGVPFVAIDKVFLMGASRIKDSLEYEIEKIIKKGHYVCPLPEEMGCHEINYTQESVNQAVPLVSGVTLPLVIGTGLIDGINPCAFAVLIFLLTFLLEISSNKKRMLKAGAAYVVAVYITYFLAGLGILAAVQTVGISSIIVKIAAVIAILTGLINIKDYFWYGKGISLAIPESKKHIIERWTYKANVPAALILGFLVSMFELPCTGGVYLAILAMLANTVTKMQAVSYLLIYNFMFILPLLIIIGMINWGMKAEHIENWRSAKKNVMRLVLGLLLLVLGIGLLVGWF